METTCAVVRTSDGFVLNTIVAAPSDPAPDGCELVEIMTGQACSTGWYRADGQFHGPRRYATCDSGSSEVVSLTSVSYVSPVPNAPAGCFLVEITDGLYADIGWTWNGTAFGQPTA